jgi:hypothetical protein
MARSGDANPKEEAADMLTHMKPVLELSVAEVAARRSVETDAESQPRAGRARLDKARDELARPKR